MLVTLETFRVKCKFSCLLRIRMILKVHFIKASNGGCAYSEAVAWKITRNSSRGHDLPKPVRLKPVGK